MELLLLAIVVVFIWVIWEIFPHRNQFRILPLKNGGYKIEEYDRHGFWYTPIGLGHKSWCLTQDEAVDKIEELKKQRQKRKEEQEKYDKEAKSWKRNNPIRYLR